MNNSEASISSKEGLQEGLKKGLKARLKGVEGLNYVEGLCSYSSKPLQEVEDVEEDVEET